MRSGSASHAVFVSVLLVVAQAALQPVNLIGGYRLPRTTVGASTFQYSMCVSITRISYQLTVSSFLGTSTTTDTSGNIQSSSCVGNVCAIEFSCLSSFGDDDDFGQTDRCNILTSCMVFNRTDGVTFGSPSPFGTTSCDLTFNPTITSGLVRLTPSAAACEGGGDLLGVVLGASIAAVVVLCIAGCVCVRCARRSATGTASLTIRAASHQSGGRPARVRLAGGGVVSANPIPASIPTAPVLAPPGAASPATPPPSGFRAPPPPAGTMAGYGSVYGGAAPPPPTSPGYAPYAASAAPPAPAYPAEPSRAPQAAPGGFGASAYPDASAPPSTAYPGASAPPSTAYPGASAPPPSAAYPGASQPHSSGPGGTQKSNDWSENSGFGL